jgi:5S rRNA maturation endonuclease (ribonuclease M5)
MISEAERLEKLERIVDDLIERSSDEPIIVEGSRDIKALRDLGIEGMIRAVNTGSSIVNLCESLSSEHDRFIILTDWDRKGGQIAHQLDRGFESCDVKRDMSVRANIARLTKKEIKDVEGLPGFIRRLQKSVLSKSPSGHYNRRRFEKD